jgi:branched-chain amino acid transport system ATP-binding protein
MLHVEDLRVVYKGGSVAVDGVSMDVDEGQVCLILGANGAGKTSLLRGITGFWQSEHGRVQGGRVTFDGRDVTGRSPRALAKAGVVLVPEDSKVFRTLTVEENLKAAPMSGSAAERRGLRAEVGELFPFIHERAKLSAGQLSGGERQMLGIARALLLRPRLLLIDEASLGLSPIATETVFARLKTVVDRWHMTLVVVEQNITVAVPIAQVAYVMEGGRFALSGRASDVVNDTQVRRAYLGVEG